MRCIAAALLGAVLLSGSSPGSASHEPFQPDSGRPEPALVVLIVVDQLRGDLLERYDALFQGGFRRLRDDGHRFTDATHRHAVTESAPGHATIITGTHPSRHGVVANTWTETVRDVERPVQATSDSMFPVIGIRFATQTPPGRSPANLLRDGLPDWMIEQDPRTRVVSVAGKGAGAILLGGRRGGEAYWLEASLGRFVTSSFYTKHDQDWLERFNREAMPALLGDSTWESTVPDGAESLARRPDFPHAGDGVNLTFPHRFDSEGGGDAPEDFHRWVATTPAPDRATAELAKHAVRQRGLGRGDATDFLAVSFSQTDIIGHAYGPLALEQLDNLLRLDRVLGDLLTFLDREVGTGRWVLALTADHGVLDVPEYLRERGFPGRRLDRREVLEIRETARAARSGAGNADERSLRVGEAVRALDFVHDAIVGAPPDTSFALGASASDTFAVFYRNSHRVDRRTGPLSGYDVRILPTEGTLMSFRGGRGTGHGSPYLHDRHVPLVFLGAGVTGGVTDEPVATVDVAPTLARLAGRAAPADLDGRPLLPRSSAHGPSQSDLTDPDRVP